MVNFEFVDIKDYNLPLLDEPIPFCGESSILVDKINIICNGV